MSTIHTVNRNRLLRNIDDRDFKVRNDAYCFACHGTGKHTSGGDCYRCQGKGFHTASDRGRNLAYDEGSASNFKQRRMFA